MATTTTTTTQDTTSVSKLNIPTQQKLRVDGTDPVYGDWRDDLARDGYAVVKGAVPRDRALNYADRMLGLLESL